jgi:hypothetical protein
METGIPIFSIGKKFKKNKPTNKKNKVKKNNIPPHIIYVLKGKIKFYNGPRWNIPQGLNASKSIRYKFSVLDTFKTFKEIKDKINEYIKSTRIQFTTEQLFNQFHNINMYYAREEHEWNTVRSIYFRLFKIKKNILPLIFNWKIKQCIKNCKNTEDPVTLEIPKKPVRIIDIKNNCSFVYEASSLRKTIENRLLYSDYMFTDPLVPLNMLSNQPFTTGQLFSAIKQCKEYGQSSWSLDAFKSVNGDIKLFEMYNKQKLKIEAIKSFFKNPTETIRETALDYFKLEAEYAELDDMHINKFINAYDKQPTMPIIQSWIGITRDYYIARQINEKVLLTKLEERINNLLNLVYIIFNCDLV